MQLQIKPTQVYLIIWMLQLLHEKDNLDYSLLIFLLLEVNLQVTNDKLSLLR